MKLHSWQVNAQRRLESSGIESSEARLELYILIEHQLGLSRSQLLLSSDRILSDIDRDHLDQLIYRRCSREPLAHLIGCWEFWSISFKVTPDTLIPRPDTEVLVEEVLKWFNQSKWSAYDQDQIRLCDIGTGTGCIPIAIASEKPNLAYHLIDYSQAALHVAENNWQRVCEQGILSPKTSVRFTHSDLLEVYQSHPLPKPTIIVSNPPYIKTKDADHLMPEVRFFDPPLALFDEGEDGLSLTRRLIAEAMALLPSQGALFLEVGFDQTKLTQKALIEAGFIKVNIRSDYGGNPRVVKGIKP